MCGSSDASERSYGMFALKQKLPEVGYSKNISMFRKFTNVIAGTGAFFAALHVFFGYMGFDKTPSETTGEIPSFFDEAEYLYYIALGGFFVLTVLVSAIFRRFPALALLPSIATTTYLMLLFDADALTAGPMTFLLFSLFVAAGHTYVALSSGDAFAKDLFRYVFAFVGLVAAVWALVVYFRAPSAPEAFAEALKPSAELDGLWAVWKYERIEALTLTFEAGDAVHYLRIALCQMISVILLILLPKLKLLLRAVSVLTIGYLVILVGWQELSYYPMFFAVPMIAHCVAILVFCACGEPLPENGDAPSGDDLPMCKEVTGK